jgi:succinate dehydrogenase hydrophobic anchor subunit
MAKKKKKPYLQVVILGILSIASYIAVFTNQEIITDFSTRGAIYAALPILAVFYFSFIHGTFASNVLSILGIEAKKKK